MSACHHAPRESHAHLTTSASAQREVAKNDEERMFEAYQVISASFKMLSSCCE